MSSTDDTSQYETDSTVLLEAQYERYESQLRLATDVANAIDFVLMETIGEHVGSDDLVFISEELRMGVFDVLHGIDDKPGYYVIPHQTTEINKKQDLVPGIYLALFDEVNN